MMRSNKVLSDKIARRGNKSMNESELAIRPKGQRLSVVVSGRFAPTRRSIQGRPS